MICEVCIADERYDDELIPIFKTKGAACADVCLPDPVELEPGEIKKVPLNISFYIPDGYHIKMYPRSSLLIKQGVLSVTSIIDTDYTGIVHVPLMNVSNKKVTFDAGTRVAQIEMCPNGIRPENWRTDDSERDQNGFGGTGTC